MPDPTAILQGDSPTFRFPVLNLAEDPLPLADYIIEFLIKRSLQDPDAAAVFVGTEDNGGVTIPFESVDGIVDITVSVAASTAMRIGRLYPWQLRLTNEFDSTKVYTPARGMFLATLPNAK